MHPEHPTQGTDAALEQRIRTMQEKLAALGFALEESALCNALENIVSLQLSHRPCPQLAVTGRGSSRQAAQADALGKFFARLYDHDFWRPYYLGDEIANRAFVHDARERWFPITGTDWPAELLTPELQARYNPEGSIPAEALIDLNTGHYERGICTLPYRRTHDQAEVFFPVNLIGNLYAGNGLGAGDSPEAARLEALAGILERHIQARVIGEGLCLPEVPDARIAVVPSCAATIADLRTAGFGVMVKDASLGGLYPVLCIALLNPADQGVITTFGAHPHWKTALEKALTAALCGHTLETLGGFPPPTLDPEAVASEENHIAHRRDGKGLVHWNFFSETPDFECTDWNFSSDTSTAADDSRWLLDCIAADGHDIYIAEGAPQGIPACRILVPGFSEIYPIAHLEWENQSKGAALRPPILHLAQLEDAECSELYVLINEMDLDDTQSVAEFIGLLADPDTLWADLCIGELKTLLALAIGDIDAILEGCAWISQCASFAADRRRVYRCIETLLNMEDPDCFEEALICLFGEDTLDLASDLIDGEIRFFGLRSPGLMLDGCGRHQELLAEYGKVLCGPD